MFHRVLVPGNITRGSVLEGEGSHGQIYLENAAYPLLEVHGTPKPLRALKRNQETCLTQHFQTYLSPELLVGRAGTA